MSRADHCSGCASRLDQASGLQLLVGPRDGAGGQSQVGGELPDGRKAVSGFQDAAGDQIGQLLANLFVGWHV
jgi:hypothetical protein